MGEGDKRRRDAGVTRAAILDAARRAFTEEGYDGAGLREIAAAAGVHASLVNRYFGTKERLFDEAVPATFSVEPLLLEDRAAFAPALARHLLTKEEGGFDATPAMLRSAGNPEAAALLRNGIEERLVAPLAAWVGGPDAAERAALVVALLSGVAVMADVLGVRALRDRPETVERLLAELTSLLVSGQATGPGETGGE